MSTHPLIPVLLAGGSGSRLSPLSTPDFPKQFLTLPGETHSLFQQSLLQAASLSDGDILIVAPESQQALLQEQMAALPCVAQVTLILEPKPGGTAAAIAAAACYAQPDKLLWILPCDHDRRAPLSLPDLAPQVMALAAQDRVVTFGLVPAQPDSGFGYVQVDDAGHVMRFVEKPDLTVAAQLIASKRAYWNSGMFAFKAECLVAELAAHHADLLQLSRASISGGSISPGIIHLNPLNYGNLSPEPIDRVVMERSDKLCLIPLPKGGWADIGTFPRLLEWWQSHAKTHAQWDFGGGRVWTLDQLKHAAARCAA